MEIHAWIGPAIVAAFISGSVSLVSLYLGGWISIRHEIRRRKEKVRDFQIALRAEIRSELHNLMSTDFDRHLENIIERYEASREYSVLPSYPARHLIFEAIVTEIHLLPEAVIDDVILYARQRFMIEKFVEEMRDERFRQMSAQRQIEMYSDFVEMQKFLTEAARLSVLALDRSLGTETLLSSPVEAPSGLKSDEGS